MDRKTGRQEEKTNDLLVFPSSCEPLRRKSGHCPLVAAPRPANTRIISDEKAVESKDIGQRRLDVEHFVHEAKFTILTIACQVAYPDLSRVRADPGDPLSTSNRHGHRRFFLTRGRFSVHVAGRGLALRARQIRIWIASAEQHSKVAALAEVGDVLIVERLG